MGTHELNSRTTMSDIKRYFSSNSCARSNVICTDERTFQFSKIYLTVQSHYSEMVWSIDLTPTLRTGRLHEIVRERSIYIEMIIFVTKRFNQIAVTVTHPVRSRKSGHLLDGWELPPTQIPQKDCGNGCVQSVLHRPNDATDNSSLPIKTIPPPLVVQHEKPAVALQQCF